MQITILMGKLSRKIFPHKLPKNSNGNVYLHLGCGTINRPEFINIDGYPYPHVHYVQGIEKLSRFHNETIDLIYACHCLEHFEYFKTKAVLEEWYRVLKGKGILRLSVPDFDKLLVIYKNNGKDLDLIMPQLMGGQNNKYNFHLTAFSMVNLFRLLTNVGFSIIQKWVPGNDNLTTFNDFSVYKKEVNGKFYEVSLNIEAIK
jgi:predicted SAM-dependent methyltransferase